MDLLALDFLTILQKSKFTPENLNAFAKREQDQNLLVAELGRLLEPADEFIRRAMQKLETRPLTESVVKAWKAVLPFALACASFPCSNYGEPRHVP
jgi:predicted type IV restriction endonuclease